MEDISIRRGATFEISFTADDDSAETVTLLVADTEGNIIINETANFATVDNKRTATISTNDTNHEIGDYEYMVSFTYSDGFIMNLPNPEDCQSDNCSLPTFSICKSIEIGVS